MPEQISKTSKKAALIVIKTYNFFYKWWNYIITAQVRSVSKYLEVPLQVCALLCFKEQSSITACFHKPKNIYRLSAKLKQVATHVEEWKEDLLFKLVFKNKNLKNQQIFYTASRAITRDEMVERRLEVIKFRVIYLLKMFLSSYQPSQLFIQECLIARER